LRSPSLQARRASEAPPIIVNNIGNDFDSLRAAFEFAFVRQDASWLNAEKPPSSSRQTHGRSTR
jgi:hypothetical protein